MARNGVFLGFLVQTASVILFDVLFRNLTQILYILLRGGQPGLARPQRWNFHMEFLQDFLSIVEKTTNRSRDLTADIAGVGYKTGPITPSKIDGVRLSEAKRAHKS